MRVSESLNKKSSYYTFLTSLILAFAAMLLLPSNGFAQFDQVSMNTAMDMNNTLSNTATPSGGIVGDVQNDLYGEGGYNNYGDGMVDQSIPVWTPAPLPDTFPARDGQRVRDAVNPLTLLDDLRDRKITQEQIDSGEFKPVGRGFENITEEDSTQYVGGRTFHYMSRSVQMLTAAHSMDILDFFGIAAMSTDSFSTLPNLRVKTAERDQKIRRREGPEFTGWANTFLRPYRVDPDSPDVAKETDFFKLYIPRPPAPPGVPAPPSPWRPPFCDKAMARLERAISAYLDQKVNEATMEMPMDMGEGTIVPQKTTADLEKERLERRAEEEATIRAQLKDAAFKAQFLIQYAPEQGGTGMGGYNDGGYSGEGYPDNGSGGYADYSSGGS